MAKGKNAAALFEVIHRDVRFSPVRRRQSPTQWIKDRLAHAPNLNPFSRADDDGNIATLEADPTQKPVRRVTPPVTPPVAPAPHPSVPCQGLGMTHLEPGDRLMTAAADSMNGASDLHSTKSTSLKVDRDKQLIKFKLTYTSAAITGFAVIVALTLAFIFGRSGPTVADAPADGLSTEQLRAGAITPGVMEIDADQGGLTGKLTAAPKPNAAPAGKPVPPPAAPTTRGDRIVGMNYVIIQSYPDQAEAQSAADSLAQNGISATVVKGTAFAPRWYSVVGLEPFDHLSGNDAYRQYVKRITQVSDTFAGNSKFKKFEPRPYKWQNH